MPAYREPNHARSIVEIAITLGPLVALWLSTMATNFPIALVVAVLIWCVGVGPFLLVHLPITLITGSVGVWLFYVQYQFDPTFWARDGESTPPRSGPVWQFALRPAGNSELVHGDIGVHHIHHLCTGIPYYRLPRALRDHPSSAR